MTEWIYRFTKNDAFPDPLEEISELSVLDEEGIPAFLMLNQRSCPPMSRASVGDIVYLCTSANGRLIVHAAGTVISEPFCGETPESVLPLYAKQISRFFCPIGDICPVDARPLDEAILSADRQRTFANGKATAKRLTATTPRPRAVVKPETNLVFHFRPPTLSPPQTPLQLGIAVGLDPTAGTWDSQMTKGPKGMPSVALQVSSDGAIRAIPNSMKIHESNADFWKCVGDHGAKLVCIDGPCSTNGPKLLNDVSGWDIISKDGQRDGERELAQQGVGLFWTTKNTVLKFLGASRWIARSLVLFSEQSDIEKIETHPHGAFTFLWRAFGKTGSPPKKIHKTGRNARIALLRAFVEDLDPESLPDHDAVDAACAALVAAFHMVGLTRAFGSVEQGGQIWMPNFAEKSLAADGEVQ